MYKHNLTVQLAGDIIEKYGDNPGPIFTPEVTPYQAVKGLYPDFDILDFSTQLNITIGIMDYMIDCSMPDYTSPFRTVIHDYWFCKISNYEDDTISGMIVDSSTTEVVHIANVTDLVDSGMMADIHDVHRLKRWLVAKEILKSTHSLLSIQA